jgi:GT2 family glycosyltransferase/predicted  nucleic acid-binding Zn-ribbon protein
VTREAFAARIPVIVSDLRAQSDAVREGIDGLHFKAGDATNLASRMRLLKDKRKTLEKLRHGIRNVPEVRRQATKLESLLRDLVRRRRTHAAAGFETILDRIERMQVEIVRLRSALREKDREALTFAETVDPSSAIAKLMELYHSREDLKKAFPEAATGHIDNLISWAANTVMGRHPDEDLRTLQPYSNWYVWIASEKNVATLNQRLHLLEDERTRLRNELSLKGEEAVRLKNELSLKGEEAVRLKNELSLKADEAATRTAELHTARDRLAILASEKDELRSKLTYTRAELDEIKRSFGYKFMRFYGSRIDRLLPDDTRRGEFRKVAVQSSRIAADQGLRALLHQAWEKMKRREFKIPEPTPGLVIEPTTILSEEHKKPDSAISPKTQMLVYCDYPDLSKNTVGKVSDSFMLTGWAVSEKGIRTVNVYLDKVFLGPAIRRVSRPDVGRAYPTFPDSHVSGFRKMVSIEGEARKGHHVLKIIAISNDESSAEIEGLVEFTESIRMEALPHRETEEVSQPIEAKASVVILTKSPPPDFEQTLERIRDQELSSTPELILVNSGIEDLSHLAERYGAKILRIDPREFDHGGTRNYGAEQATGDYIFFMTDDAIPASTNLLRDMMKVLESDGRIVAASGRQIPRSDADLMACQAIWGHYRMLGLDSDRIVSSPDLDNMGPQEKRRLCQIDDVCSCFRRDVFLRYKYAVGLAYAEDLDLGIKLVKDGFKIAQLLSTGVVHSHNRPASYYMKRTYVDVKTLSQLLGHDWTQLKQLDRGAIDSLDDLLDCILDLYDSVCLAADDLRENGFCKGDITKAFGTIERRLTAQSRIAAAPESSNRDLLEILHQTARIARHRHGHKIGSNPLSRSYFISLGTFEEWLSNTHQNLTGMEDEFVDALYKLLGVEIGRCLGEYYALSQAGGDEDSRVAQLDEFLSEGV